MRGPKLWPGKNASHCSQYDLDTAKQRLKSRQPYRNTIMENFAFIATITTLILYLLLRRKSSKLKETDLLADKLERRIIELRKLTEIESAKNKQLEEQIEALRKQIVPEEEAKAAWAAFEKEKKDIELRLHELKLTEQRELKVLNEQIDCVREDINLHELGFRKRSFTYEDPKSYQDAIAALEDRISDALKSGNAACCIKNWAIEGSQKKGELMIKKMLKIAIRAFNADADAAIARVKWNNIKIMEQRIRKSEETIEKCLDEWGIVIVDTYRDMKIQELYLTHEQEEVEHRIKEEQRAIKEQMRDEEKARREAEKARLDSEREERRLQQALAKAKQEMDASHTADMTKHVMKIKELELLLAQAGDTKLRAISMSQLTKMGYVYIISNIGSFGDNVFKIGMTRRLDPMDRVWELSDASVPFDFDVHALIKCDDAPALENKLHETFSDRRLNMVNDRKEFFRVTIAEIQQIVSKEGFDVKLTELAEAREFVESEALRKQSVN
jgi:hypothetical protein